LPEGVYPIVKATLYLATVPKSNTATALLGTYFYSPSEKGYEAQVTEQLALACGAREGAGAGADGDPARAF
jgi:hypothetical protein